MKTIDYKASEDARVEAGDMLAYPIQDPQGGYAVLVRTNTFDWPDTEKLIKGEEAEIGSNSQEPMGFIVRPLESQWVICDFTDIEEDSFQALWADVEGMS